MATSDGKPFLHKSHKWMVLVVFLGTMYVWSYGSWQGMVLVDAYVTRYLYKVSDALHGLTPDWNEYDESEMRLLYDDSLSVVVKDPAGYKIGTDIDGIQYDESDNFTVEKITLVREAKRESQSATYVKMDMVKLKPYNGTYRFTLTPLESGTHLIQIEFSDRGNETRKIYNLRIAGNRGVSKEYIIRYHKDAITRTQLEEGGAFTSKFNAESVLEQ